MTKTFRDLDVASELCDALEANGITHPFPIQELTLPLALGGHDLIGQARTGTGKTLAFGLPLLQRVDPALKQTQALVIVPTRELCLQVYDDLSIGSTLGLTSISVYGGVGYDEQIDALTGGAHVVVGTPGRLLDLFNRGVLDLSKVTQLVLDEADEMLDMGFLPDVERLIEGCKGDDRHTMLFSATMPTAIVKLARRYMDHPTFTRADHEVKTTADNVTQHFFQVHRMDKPRLLARILQDENRGGVYVFVRTKHMADRLVNDLEELRIPAIAIHGDLRQSTREKNLDRFRDGSATVLVCTEVAARGLDVSGVTHVVNYDCPDDEKMYLHRIGRTARAGEAGVAVTFAEFNEIDRLNVIRKKVEATDAEVHQVFSTSPVLDELFTLPAEKPWEHLTNVGGGNDGPRGAGGTRDRSKGDGSKGDGSKGDRSKGGSSKGGGSRGGAKGGGSRGGAKGGGAKGADAKGADAKGDETKGRNDQRANAGRGAGRDDTQGRGGKGGGPRGDKARDADSEAATTSTAKAATTVDSRAGSDDTGADATDTDSGARSSRRSAGSGDGRRSPSTDGKPKSGRAREGRGGDHDSRPSTRGGARTSRSGGDDTRDDAAASPDDSTGRTRTRTRTRSSGGDAGNGTDGGSGSTSSSGRTRARGGAPAKDRNQSAEEAPSGTRGGRSGSSDSDTSGSRQRARGGRNRQSRSRSSSDGGKQSADGDAGGGVGNHGAREGASSSGRDSSARGDSAGSGSSRGAGRGGSRGGSPRDGSKRSGNQGSTGNDRSSSADRDPTVRLSKRGQDARGGGEPQLARRVKVEHLP